jgi:hypothetical protein
MFVLRSARVLLGYLIFWVSLPASMLYADEIDLMASKDNTIYSEGDLSNGVGQYLFSGTTANVDFRRALIKFDIAANIPTGATIDSVQLSLNVSKVPDSSSQSFSLFRLTTEWGEGSSNAPREEGAGADARTGDATWAHTLFPFEFWSTAGGDFEPEVSATALIGGLGAAVWPSTGELVADVQMWLEQPESNFGWILVGDESTISSAKRFDSRENPTAALGPRLKVLFTPAPPTGACCSTIGDCTDVQASVCKASGGYLNSPGSSCALIQECPLFQDGFENLD